MSEASQVAFPVVVDTSRSVYARLRPVPLSAVELGDTFWAPRWRINREITLPSQHQLLEETGRIDNFRRAAGKIGGPFHGLFFNDSDVYKWLEAVAWTLALEPDAGLASLADQVIAEVGAAQRPDGYLNSYFALDRASDRWTNLKDLHELYCAGHLFQAAVAHYRATGKSSLLDIARRFAEHICDTFGPPEVEDPHRGAGKRPGTCGHPEIEMGLVELARATGEPRYLAQAQYFLDARGHGLIGSGLYVQDHTPFRQLDRMVGHAVRAVYLNAGATDLLAESGEPALQISLDRMWASMTERQMYVSGGVGSRYEGEAFGADYELPNARAYTETCAAIAAIMWAWRMLALTGDAGYADMMEQVLYNGFLSGLGLDGKSYFYVNPLANDGTHRRQPWFDCACCPPNVARMIASLPGYFYSTSDDGLWVHLYAESFAQWTLPDGRPVAVSVHTGYPWDGDVVLEVQGDGDFVLFLRVPAWTQRAGASLEVNGQPWSSRAQPSNLSPGTYAQIRRTWQSGDTVRLTLPMPVRRVESHPHVAENRGSVALMRGPLLYCIEGSDNPGVDPRDIVLSPDAAILADHRPDLLGGVTVLHTTAQVVPPDDRWEGQLYRTVGTDPAAISDRTVEITAVPYHAWANREPGPMQVWLRRTVQPQPPS
jgi:DUF1680 family protein